MTTQRYDRHQVRRIAERASDLYAKYGDKRDQVSFVWDIATCAVRLDLDRLEGFDDASFIHDVAGIATHLDHNTGELRGCFLPRCAA